MADRLGRNPHSARDEAAVLQPMRNACAEVGAGLVVIHHPPKADEGDVRGSDDCLALARVGLCLLRAPTSTRWRVDYSKWSYLAGRPAPFDIDVRIAGDQSRVDIEHRGRGVEARPVPRPDVTDEADDELLFNAVVSGPGRTTNQLAEDIRKGKTAVADALARLDKAGRVQRRKRGNRKEWFAP